MPKCQYMYRVYHFWSVSSFCLYLNKFGKLSTQEILVVTSAYTVWGQESNQASARRGRSRLYVFVTNGRTGASIIYKSLAAPGLFQPAAWYLDPIGHNNPSCYRRLASCSDNVPSFLTLLCHKQKNGENF